jgi:hypothetical protein
VRDKASRSVLKNPLLAAILAVLPNKFLLMEHRQFTIYGQTTFVPTCLKQYKSVFRIFFNEF